MSWAQTTLEQKIATLLQKQYSQNNVAFQVELKQPVTELCDEPLLRITGSDRRLAGNMSILADCTGRHRFIQVLVHASGSYWVAKRPLTPGTPVLADDIQLFRGALDKLPADLVFQNEDIVGSVPLRYITVGEPLVRKAMRKAWLIRNGQRVDIIAQGVGFSIHSQGNAMGNVGLNDRVRARMSSGKIVTGIVFAPGKIHVVQ